MMHAMQSLPRIHWAFPSICPFTNATTGLQEKRKALLDRFYTSFDAQVPALILSPHACWQQSCSSP